MSYDSTQDTIAHIERVRELLYQVEMQVAKRGAEHDTTKLEEPEKSMYDRFTPKLRSSVYMSDAYKRFLEEMGPALAHHYEHNSHHPEHYPNGIDGMSLLDLIEMLADWKAAGERHADGGSLERSIHQNQERFGYDDVMRLRLLRTADELGWL